MHASGQGSKTLAAASDSENAREEGFLVSGDAAEASAAIEAWLQRRAATPEPDWRHVLLQIRSALQTLCASPLVQSDDRAQAIIRRMVSAENIEDLAADIDRLGDRIAELTGSFGRRRSAPVFSIADFDQRAGKRRQAEAEDDLERPLARMVLKL